MQAHGANTMDVPFRFLPCMTAGLSVYDLATESARTELAAWLLLKQQYDEAWELAATEDRDKSSFSLCTSVHGD
jgi:hypothetical protein